MLSMVYEKHFHDIIFNHPLFSLRSLIPFGFRPISLRSAPNSGFSYVHSFRHTVVFNYYRLNKVWSFATCRHVTTTTSANFSRQALLQWLSINSLFTIVRETSSDKGINFPSYVCFIYTDCSELPCKRMQSQACLNYAERSW